VLSQPGDGIEVTLDLSAGIAFSNPEMSLKVDFNSNRG
jgi:hypothetical protein